MSIENAIFLIIIGIIFPLFIECKNHLRELSDEIFENSTVIQQISSDITITDKKTMVVKVSVDFEVERTGNFYKPFFVLKAKHKVDQGTPEMDVTFKYFMLNENTTSWGEPIETKQATCEFTPLTMSPLNYQRSYSFIFKVETYKTSKSSKTRIATESNENTSSFLASKVIQYNVLLDEEVIIESKGIPVWLIIIIVLSSLLLIMIVIFIICLFNRPKVVMPSNTNPNEENTEPDIRRRVTSIFAPVVKKEETLVTDARREFTLEMNAG